MLPHLFKSQAIALCMRARIQAFTIIHASESAPDETRTFRIEACVHADSRIEAPVRICEVHVEGLETPDYLDNMQNKKSSTEQGDAITFESEVDKIYLRTPTKIAILDREKKRTFVVCKDGLPDAQGQLHQCWA